MDRVHSGFAAVIEICKRQRSRAGKFYFRGKWEERHSQRKSQSFSDSDHPSRWPSTFLNNPLSILLMSLPLGPLIIITRWLHGITMNREAWATPRYLFLRRWEETRAFFLVDPRTYPRRSLRLFVRSVHCRRRSIEYPTTWVIYSNVLLGRRKYAGKTIPMAIHCSRLRFFASTTGWFSRELLVTSVTEAFSSYVRFILLWELPCYMLRFISNFQMLTKYWKKWCS